MKKLISLSVLFFIMFSFAGTKAMSATNDSPLAFSPNDEKVEVYYVHYTRRCATCNAVEDEAKKALERFFPEQMKNGTIIFLSVNFEEEGNDQLAEQLGASGQSLLFVKGDKKIDLTNYAFMNARTNSEKFHKRVKKTVESLME
ncbi:MAG: nitrophenyl compound nitroreductase subunit ArsF family protein [Tangfeifania sp.]